MTLSERERLVAHVANALTVYSIRRSENALPQYATPHQFVLDVIPDELRDRLTADIIDDVFASLSR